MKASTSIQPPTGTAPSAQSLDTAHSSRQWTWPLYRQLLRSTNLPILAGPWRGEVGIEALYWIPFLLKLQADLGGAKDRIIPVTRGGAAHWYGQAKGVELYALRSVQEVRIATRLQHAGNGLLKQTHVNAWDRAVIKDAAKALGLKRYLTVHPAWMYQTLRPFWTGDRGADWLSRRIVMPTTLPAPALPPEMRAKLPEHFLAARFYARSTFPAMPGTAQCAKAMLLRASQQLPVVLLNNPVHADEHCDYTPHEPIPNVYQMADLLPLTAENGLAMQSAVMAASDGFIGTYGGLAQLAHRFGKRCVTVYTEWKGAAIAHRQLSEWVGYQTNVPFAVFKVDELPLFQSVLPKVLLQVEPSPQSVAPAPLTPELVGVS
jgi:hypothetical protein